MEELEFKEYTVTCHTLECGNGELAITLLAPVTDPYFICGVCGQVITDVA
jgi:hypothetical protein